MTQQQQHFEQLYRHHPDPWDVASSTYEIEKRERLLLALPRPRYRHGFEPGCGNGATTERLLDRCDALCAADLSASAIGLCRERVQNVPHGRLHLQTLALPSQWPDIPRQGFDLIVVSELAYYFDDGALDGFLESCWSSLADGGDWLMCHWRRDFSDRLQHTDALHAQVAALPRMVLQSSHVEPDFRLDVWRKDPHEACA